MKNFTMLFFVAAMQAITIPALYAQNEVPSCMVRTSEDNDFINDLGKGTDDAYTNGTRADLFYNKIHPSKLFIDRWMPKAGDSSSNTFSIGLAEVMYTPSNLTDLYYQPNDYAWAGGLYISHALYSYNPQKKYDFQTELVGGVIGPDAFAKPVQQTVHHLIQDPAIPQGWDNQFHNDVLLNVNFTAEKEFFHIGDFAELIGSGQALAGTMTDGLDLSPVLIIGKMTPYFNGYTSQYSSKSNGKEGKVQAYLKLKPGIQLVAWNSMLEGGMFSQQPLAKVEETANQMKADHNDGYIRQPVPQIENEVTYMTFSVVVVTGPFCISYSQTHTSELVRNTYSHTYGNISLSYSLLHGAKRS